MGTQIAAHLANAGLVVHLLNPAAKSGAKNDAVEAAFKRAQSQSPPIFFTQNTARRVILGNFDDHFHRIADADWIIEAIVENLAIKQELMARVEAIAHDEAIISTNTSGLSVEAIAHGRSNSFQQRFLGTHFFNPPRYLKLLELIPTPQTKPQVLDQMQEFGQTRLGKGIIIVHDTPNFIANRIGMYALMLGLRAWTDGDYTIEEVDQLTGTLVGRPKSATFRTADLVGLDTIMHVVKHLYPAIPDDESREVFQVPKVLHELVVAGAVGAKVGRGFYQKQGNEILSVNPDTLAYESAKPINLEGIEAIASLPLPDRLQALYHDSGRAGALVNPMILDLLHYCACRLPEITTDPSDVDRAMRWGFGWELGPFEIWNVLGYEQVLEDMTAAGLSVPASCHEGSIKHYFAASTGFCSSKCVTLTQTSQQQTLWHNSEAALLDLGDGVVQYEFRSKGNTLSLKVIEGLSEILDQLEQRSDWKGLVIGNDSPNFSAGANLVEMGMMAQSGHIEAIAQLIHQFQSLLQRIHYFPKPIIAAVQGRALGGGCELVMACPHVVAAAETYLGLVELGVGLIPAGGGLMRMVDRAAERAASDDLGQVLPFLRAAFETIALAKVANSAYEAQELGFLPDQARILMVGDRRLEVAKAEVLHLHVIGYVPPPPRVAIRALGQPARAVLEHAAYIVQQGGYASDYDRHLAQQLAWVMTGGALSTPDFVPENYLLQLERETFLPLLQQPKTQARIEHMLKTKKPLRN
jgi:3-hydroxyacyl-CoA dehydrogenase